MHARCANIEYRWVCPEANAAVERLQKLNFLKNGEIYVKNTRILENFT